MYMKWDYTAVDQNHSNYYKMYYNGKPIFVQWNWQQVLFSIRFILDMGFKEMV